MWASARAGACPDGHSVMGTGLALGALPVDEQSASAVEGHESAQTPDLTACPFTGLSWTFRDSPARV